MRRNAVAMSLGLTSCLVAAGCKSTAGSSSRVLEKPASVYTQSAGDPSLLIAFAAKGTNVGIDAGFMHALWEQNLASVQQGQVVVSGSSSGSIMAAIFGCWGVTKDGLNVMDTVLSPQVFNKAKIDLPLSTVVAGLVLGYGSKVAQPASNLDGIINAVTNYNGKVCNPTFPFVITATNQDVVNAVNSLPLSPFDPVTTEVLQVAGVPVPIYYYNVPFVGGNTNIQIDLNAYTVSNTHQGSGDAPTYTGRACTYFVSQIMFDALSQIPDNERLCDLRKVLTASDVQLAVRASVSEPTYFAPVVEPSPQVIVPAVYNGRSVPATGRVYNGGYGMTIVTQDLKRRFPQMYVFGTGRTPFSANQAQVIQNWYRVPLNEAINRGRYWLDAEIPWSVAEWNDIGTDSPQGNVARGYARFNDCLNSKLLYPHGCNLDASTVIAPSVPSDYQGKTLVVNGRPMDAWIASQQNGTPSQANTLPTTSDSSSTIDPDDSVPSDVGSPDHSAPGAALR